MHIKARRVSLISRTTTVSSVGFEKFFLQFDIVPPPLSIFDHKKKKKIRRVGMNAKVQTNVKRIIKPMNNKSFEKSVLFVGHAWIEDTFFLFWS